MGYRGGEGTESGRATQDPSSLCPSEGFGFGEGGGGGGRNGGLRAVVQSKPHSVGTMRSPLGEGTHGWDDRSAGVVSKCVAEASQPQRLRAGEGDEVMAIGAWAARGVGAEGLGGKSLTCFLTPEY
mgnify:CR=1 FL=1